MCLRHGFEISSSKRRLSTQKAAGNPAAFRFLSELLRGHKSRASFPTVRANCVQAQPGSAGTRLRHFIICARGTASRLSLGPAGGDSLAPLAGSSSLAILGTERVCNRFYTPSWLWVCTGPVHAPEYTKSGRPQGICRFSLSIRTSPRAQG